MSRRMPVSVSSSVASSGREGLATGDHRPQRGRQSAGPEQLARGPKACWPATSRRSPRRRAPVRSGWPARLPPTISGPSTSRMNGSKLREMLVVVTANSSALERVADPGQHAGQTPVGHLDRLGRTRRARGEEDVRDRRPVGLGHLGAAGVRMPALGAGRDRCRVEHGERPGRGGAHLPGRRPASPARPGRPSRRSRAGRVLGVERDVRRTVRSQTPIMAAMASFGAGQAHPDRSPVPMPAAERRAPPTSPPGGVRS